MEEILTVNECREGDTGVVAPVGEVDMQSMRPFREVVRRLQEEGVRHIIFDLREVTFMDSAGMSVLFGAKKLLNDEHGDCCIVTEENGTLEKSLSTISIETVMPHLHNLEDARSAINAMKEARRDGSHRETVPA